jgi:L-type amino acid transporter 9
MLLTKVPMRHWIKESRQCKNLHPRFSSVLGLIAFSNALILNTVLSAVYILFGNMRILLTLNGLAEYFFFFLTVLGAIILRWREPELHRPVKPFILIPVIFAIISGFVVVRGAIFAPVQATILVGIWVVGAVYYYVRRRFFRA